MKRLFILLFVLAAIQLGAAHVETELVSIVFKIKPAYQLQMQKSHNRSGINSLDSRLQQIKVSSLNNYFTFSPTRAIAHELGLIYTITTDYPPQAAVNLLKKDEAVEYAELIYPDEVFAVPNDPYFATSTYFSSLQAELAWDIHKGEDGTQPVILALVDTGCRWSHPDIAENIWNNLGEDANGNGYTMYYNGSAWVLDTGDLNGIDDDGNGFIDDLIGWDFMLNALGDMHYNPYESSGHGTRVGGIMNARTNNGTGVSSLAWNLVLMPISCSHPAEPSSVYRGYNAIIYAAENGADIINCSWGGTTYSQAAQEAINYAHSLGSIIIAAAGNSNNAIPIYPAAYKNVLAVAALDNDGKKVSSSNYGAYVDVGAPTISMGTLNSGDYAYVGSATSYASPVASSLAGLIKSYLPSITQEELIQRIKGSCNNVDAVNPAYQNLLGQGKLNAYQALSQANPLTDSEVRLGLIENRGATDANNNRAVEPGEMFSINLLLRSYGDYPANGTFVLSTSNSNVEILSNTHYQSIPADDYIDLQSVFSVRAKPTATSQYVSFTLTTTADLPVVSGGTLSFSILIHNGGYFVWEGVANGRDMSGTYIRNELQNMGKQVVYGSTFPPSFLNFDGIFLSFGAVGTDIVRFNNEFMFIALKEYLQAGGRVYIEGTDVVGFDMGYYLPDVEAGQDAHEILWPLLGIAAADDGATHAISNLTGVSQTPTAGMHFTASNQESVDYIDTFTPIAAYAKSAFEEAGYGTVAVASLGGYSQRSMVFSYALSKLVDESFPSTRANLLAQIVSFFEAAEVTLPVELSSFTASYNDSAILTWITASETNLIGYNVYRAFEPSLENAEKANWELIPATGGSQGAKYTFADEELPAGNTLYYWLEAVFYTGNQQFYGPVSLSVPDPSDPNAPPPTETRQISLFAYPNPFSSSLDLQILMPAKQRLNIQIYNIRGQLITQYPTLDYDTGSHKLFWNGKDSSGRPAAPGIYLLELKSPNQLIRKKVVKM